MLTEKISKLAEILSTDSLTKTSNKMHMTSIIELSEQLALRFQVKLGMTESASS